MDRKHIVTFQGRDFVTFPGLLALAHEKGLKGIRVTLIQVPHESNDHTAICAAEVEMPDGTYSDIGDASPTNVSRNIAPHIIRMASTRAKARTLRDATNVGITAFEELSEDDQQSARPEPQTSTQRAETPPQSRQPSRGNPASQKQIDYIQVIAEGMWLAVETEGMSSVEASALLDGLKGEGPGKGKEFRHPRLKPAGTQAPDVNERPANVDETRRNPPSAATGAESDHADTAEHWTQAGNREPTGHNQKAQRTTRQRVASGP
jgi:hypothetical protein